MQNLFPALTEDEVLERVEESWDLSGDFPMPKFAVKCPVCGSEEIQARLWQFTHKDSGGAKYRCNVSFKCTRCSAVWMHGVVIPEEMFRKHVKENENQAKMYHWREVKEMVK